MKLFRYKNFIREPEEDVHSICRKYNIRNYVINEDGTIDVGGSVDISNNRLTELPLKFRKVRLYFDCSYNELTNLEGSPKEVNSGFYCNWNRLTSLEGSPEKVSGSFCCYNNKLSSLVGSPSEIGGNFSCFDNRLTSLEGSPNKVGGHFDCSYNKLTSLEGSPEKVGGYFCNNNQLTSLEGISKYIVGCNCEYNQLRDVKGVPDGWRGTFYVFGNPVYEIFKLFPKERWDEVIEHLNDYNVIRDGKIVILQALERVFWELDIEVPEIEEIKGYEIQY